MRKMVHDFATEKITPFIEEMEENDTFPRPIIDQMGELGLMGIPIAKEYDGSGMDFTSYIIVILNSSIVFIINGGEAGTYLVFAKTNPEKGSRGISAFIVEKDTPGFR
ncbi:acyl-CoA dehydrogenase family protein [Alkalihalobacillus sp. BA299]|uniref:acyl-CoA dehydrogenase family protein n=1 Tax=Alkalihalobacillus sp. BA299 TaxID=2815938 RepID=UPI0035AB8C67